MSIRYPDTLRSNNPNEYGIACASEMIGSKVVDSISDLYDIPIGLLTTDKTKSSGENSEGNIWYVKSIDKFYYLKDFT